MSDQAAALTEKIREHVKGNWLHNIEIAPSKEIFVADNLEYRSRILGGIFATLFVERSVVVLDEASGVYPALVRRAGAGEVTASSANEATCDLIREVTQFLDAPAEVVNSKLVAFYDSEPYVDMQYGEGFEFLLALGQIWPMYGAAGQSFDAVVEACAFVVSDGLVFDWTDAEWAKPPPPPEYNRAEFVRALGKKFDYVTAVSDAIVVAAGKLPPDGADAADVT
jgi:hypothetical protein